MILWLNDKWKEIIIFFFYNAFAIFEVSYYSKLKRILGFGEFLSLVLFSSN